MNDTQFVVKTIKKLDYYCTPLELWHEVSGANGIPITALGLDKILKQLYKNNKFIYDDDGTIVWTAVTKKQRKKFNKEFTPLR